MINDIATTKKIAAPAHRSTFSTPTLGGVVKFNCCARVERDRKSTCLNSSHDQISYAVFCLKKKKKHILNGKDEKLKYIRDVSTRTVQELRHWPGLRRKPLKKHNKQFPLNWCVEFTTTTHLVVAVLPLPLSLLRSLSSPF